MGYGSDWPVDKEVQIIEVAPCSHCEVAYIHIVLNSPHPSVTSNQTITLRKLGFLLIAIPTKPLSKTLYAQSGHTGCTIHVFDIALSPQATPCHQVLVQKKAMHIHPSAGAIHLLSVLHTYTQTHTCIFTHRQTHKTYMNHKQQNWDHVSVREQTTCACMHR